MSLAQYKRHNKKVLSDEPPAVAAKCNCRNKNSCSLEGKCLESSIVYRGSIISGDHHDGADYIGVTENTFKDRNYKHRNSFKYESKVNSTELSKYVWDLKKKGITNPVINWSIIDYASTYVNGSKKCNLCLTEKDHIIMSPLNLLNKRTELVSKCRHENKHYLFN